MAAVTSSQAPSSITRSVFDPASTSGDELDWSSIYHYIGLATSALTEAGECLHLLRTVHSGILHDGKLVETVANVEQLRDRVRSLAACAYARSVEQGGAR